MAIVCTTSFTGIGRTCKKENSLTVMRGGFLAKSSFQFASFSSFGTEADWLTAIAAGNLYPVHGFKNWENQKVEDGIQEGDIGQKSLSYRGMDGYQAMIKSTLQDHKALKTYSNGDWRWFPYDANNNILGTTPDGIAVQGLELEYFDVGSQIRASADQAAMTPITIQESNPKEWNDEGIYIENADFLASNLKGVVRCTITASTVSTNVFTLTVTYADNSALSSVGVAGSSAILGLLAANVVITNQAGVVAVAVTAVDTTPATGVYTVTGSLTSGTVIITASSALLFDSARLTLAAA